MAVERHMWIGGSEVEAAAGARFERRSPATGEVVGVYPEASPEDAERAIAAARLAFDDGRWSGLAAKKRAAILRRTADLLRAGADELAAVIAREAGKPLRL